MTPERIKEQLDRQGWKCAYTCATGQREGGAILPGDALAKAYDGVGLVHLTCALVGQAPER